MRDRIPVLLAAAVLSSAPVRTAQAAGWVDQGADLLTGGMYTANRETAFATDSLVADVAALKDELSALIASLDRLGPHVEDSVARSAGAATTVARERIQATRSLPGRASAAIARRRSALERDLRLFEPLAARLAAARSDEQARPLRDELRRLGARIAGAARQEGGRALLPAAFLPPGAEPAACDRDHAFGEPAAAVAALRAASARMRKLGTAIDASMAGRIAASADLAVVHMRQESSVARSCTVAALQNVRIGLGFGVNELRAAVQTLARVTREPWRLIDDPLEPIRATLWNTQRAFDELDSEIERATRRLHEDVLVATRNALSHSEQLQFTLLEHDRLVLGIRDAAVQAMACGDVASLNALSQAIQAEPRELRVVGWTNEGALEDVRIPLAKVAALGPLGRARTISQRAAASQQRFASRMEQAYRRVVPQEGDAQELLDALFLGRTPREIARRRTEIMKAVRTKLRSQPRLVLAAERSLDREIAARKGRRAGREREVAQGPGGHDG